MRKSSAVISKGSGVASLGDSAALNSLGSGLVSLETGVVSLGGTSLEGELDRLSGVCSLGFDATVSGSDSRWETTVTVEMTVPSMTAA